MQSATVSARVVEYQLDDPGLPDAEQRYRLLCTILDPPQAPAPELAALHSERWEIEGAVDELKTHQRGPRAVLRSKRRPTNTPETSTMIQTPPKPRCENRRTSPEHRVEPVQELAERLVVAASARAGRRALGMRVAAAGSG